MPKAAVTKTQLTARAVTELGRVAIRKQLTVMTQPGAPAPAQKFADLFKPSPYAGPQNETPNLDRAPENVAARAARIIGDRLAAPHNRAAQVRGKSMAATTNLDADALVALSLARSAAHFLASGGDA